MTDSLSLHIFAYMKSSIEVSDASYSKDPKD